VDILHRAFIDQSTKSGHESFQMKPDDWMLSGRERGDPEKARRVAGQSQFCGGCDYCCMKATQIGQQIEVSVLFPSL